MTRAELESAIWDVLTRAMSPDLKLSTIMALADCFTENRKGALTSEDICSTRNQDVQVRAPAEEARPAYLRAVP